MVKVMAETESEKVIRENTKIFAWNGFLGRMGFTVNTIALHIILVVFSIFWAFFVALAGFMNRGDIVDASIFLYKAFLIIFSVIFYSNIVRRVRDFAEKYAVWLSILFICGLFVTRKFSLILYLLVLLMLLLIPGKRENTIKNKLKYVIYIGLILILFAIKFFILHIILNN
jgi:hypothetical protein